MYNRTTLTYKPFSVYKFWHMKQCLRKLILLILNLQDVFTVKNVPLRHFLTYMDMRVCKFWHTTPCLCAVSNIISDCFTLYDVSLQIVSTVRRDDVQFFTKKTLFCAILTYEDCSMCKYSHRRTCMYATCHIISYVLSRLPRFHTNVSSARRVHMCAFAH